MVRLRREMEGLDPDPSRVPPAYLRDERLRGPIEEAARRAMWSLLEDGFQTVLMAGLPPTIVTELAERGCSVTVVEPDPERVRLLQEEILRRSLFRKISIIQKELGQVSFEPSSFEAAIVFDELNRYPLPSNVVRKTARELKMGGRFFAKITVREAEEGKASGPVRTLVGGLRRRLSGGKEAAPYAIALEPLLDDLRKVLSVKDIGQSKGISPVIASAVARLPGRLVTLGARALGPARDVDEALSSVLERGTFIAWISATKDIGFGRVFTPIAR